MRTGESCTLSDCCSNFAAMALAPANLLITAEPNVSLPPDKARTGLVEENSALASVSPEEDMVGRLDSAKSADFSRRVQDELPFLRKIVRRWHRDRANADDLIQETVLRALANAHLWQPGSNLRGWLVIIMRNQFLAATAKSKRSTELLEIWGERDVCAAEASGTRLVLRDVERALRRLPSIQRTVLTAVAIDGRSHAEVADALGLSVGAVRCHLTRARQRLRAAVEGGTRAVQFGNRRRSVARILVLPAALPVPAISRMPLAASIDIASGVLLGAD